MTATHSRKTLRLTLDAQLQVLTGKPNANARDGRQVGNAVIRQLWDATPFQWDTASGSNRRDAVCRVLFGGELPPVLRGQLVEDDTPEPVSAPTPAVMPSAPRVTTPRAVVPTAVEARHTGLVAVLTLLTDAGDKLAAAVGADSPLVAKVRNLYVAIRDERDTAAKALQAERTAKTPVVRPPADLHKPVAAPEANAKPAAPKPAEQPAAPKPAEQPKPAAQQQPTPCASPAQSAPETAPKPAAPAADDKAALLKEYAELGGNAGLAAKWGVDAIRRNVTKLRAKPAPEQPEPPKAVSVTVTVATEEMAKHVRAIAALSAEKLAELVRFIDAL